MSLLWWPFMLMVYLAGGAATAYLVGRYVDLDHDAAAFVSVFWPVLGTILLPLALFEHLAKKGAKDAE